MKTTENTPTDAPTGTRGGHEPELPVPSRRWWLLCVLSSAQLMVVLDNTIVNVALPSAQADLGFGQSSRQWVVTAYALAFGALVLLGGRMSDRFGRKRAFVAGLIGFAGASAIGGAATGFTMLVIARTVQGAFGALLAPSVLSLINQTFPRGRSRSLAFGILSTIVGSGAAIGLLLGGVLTEYLNWRWTMYVNVGFATAAAIGAGILLGQERREGPAPKIDLASAALAGIGLLGVVYGLACAENGDWASPNVLGPLLAGIVVLAGFVLRQRNARSPLLPLSILRDRARVGAFVNRFTASTGNFAVVFFMTFFLQENLGMSPVLSGLGVVPMAIGIIAGSNASGAILASRLGPRAVSVIGLLVSAVALWWLSWLRPSTTYWSGIPAPLLLFGLGQGMSTSVAMNTATHNLPTDHVGAASALVNVMQQLGGSIGTALLSSIAASAAASYATTHHTQGTAADTYGYGIAFLTAAAIFTATALVCGILIRGRRYQDHAAV
ncbi:MFS transporter [Streptomyces sp. NPDC055105]|uniref:MFS transporter n=1 Tax=Streptomyces sp. NPDC055105 TaxID=3365719 RepID=UPI0037D2ED96